MIRGSRFLPRAIEPSQGHAVTAPLDVDFDVARLAPAILNERRDAGHANTCHVGSSFLGIGGQPTPAYGRPTWYFRGEESASWRACRCRKAVVQLGGLCGRTVRSISCPAARSSLLSTEVRCARRGSPVAID